MKSTKPYQRKLSFHKITLADLQSFIEINEIVDCKPFDEWFSYAYSLTDEEKGLLTALVEPNIIYFDSFTEEELKAKFIIPILNKIDFRGPKIRDWYERPLKGVINGVLLTGPTDFMVATGIETPQSPFFFIQEYKKLLGQNHPKNPLLAEMIVAMQQNGRNRMLGAFVISKFWQFVIIDKLKDWEYRYYISRDFSAIQIEDVFAIYKNLQFIKSLYIISPR
jgi:hypothetical protein